MPTPSRATTLSSAGSGSCSATASATVSGSRCTRRRGWRARPMARWPEGAVVTIEPGIYRPGWGGVRIEDDVVLGADGPQILTTVHARADRARMSRDDVVRRDYSEAYDRPTLRQEADRHHRRVDRRLDRDHVGQGDEDPHLEEPAAARRGADGRADAMPAMVPASARRAAPTPAEGIPVVRTTASPARRAAEGDGARGEVADGRHVLQVARAGRQSIRRRSAIRVSKGQILCIIEAMKIMNEIESEYAGVVTRDSRRRTRSRSSTGRCCSGSIPMANPAAAVAARRRRAAPRRRGARGRSTSRRSCSS